MIIKLALLLGKIINEIYKICNNYGLSIIVFTVFAKIILFPINIIIQKNSIKMIKIRPKIEELKFKYSSNKEKFMEEQIKLFDEEKYKPSLSVIPLLIQIPIVLSLMQVIKNSQNYIENLNDIFFLGIDLTAVPTFNNYIVVPIIAIISTILLCVFQNRNNVLQKEENIVSKISTSLLTIFLTAYFIFLVPCGVGIYWIMGNILSILQMYLLNAMYPPEKYINYEKLIYWKDLNNQKREEKKKYKEKERNDYKKFFEEDNIKNMKLIFYSEQNGFYKYFSGTIKYIIENSDVIVHYITSDPKDNIFNIQNDKLKAYYIGTNKLIPLFMKLEADVVVMTTPDFEKYYLKRSLVKKDIEYLYVDHGMVSINLTLRTGALDHFDTVFASGPEQVKEIREIEELRQTKRKKIVEVGYPFMDDLIRDYNKIKSKKIDNIKTILIAPSHQEDNILESCIDEIIEQLLDKNYKIIIRPHPQFIKRNNQRIEELLEKYKDKFNENFYFELDFASNETIYLSDIVITDWSGIGVEYSVATTKPTLYINTKIKIINKDYDKINTKPLDITLRNKTGREIEKDDVKNIAQIIEELLKNQKEYEKQNIDIRNKYLFNLGNSGRVGAEYIINQIKRKENEICKH